MAWDKLSPLIGTTIENSHPKVLANWAALETAIGISGGVLKPATPKSLFDANTILAADVDNTPAALTITASRIVGRKSSGSIAALTAAEVLTILDVPTNSEAVLDTLFNANTILAADSNDTPAALTIAEQRVVGRITGGNIVGLTAAQILTLINVEAGATADQTEAEILTLLGLTSVEVDQVGNLGAITISAGQWGYLGGMDQALAQANSPTFAGLTISGDSSLDGAVVINEAGADKDFRIETSGKANSFFIDGANGKVFINGNLNAKALGPSLTIDGAGQDGEYLTLQDSTNVAHGMTANTETNTFGVLSKLGNASGGLAIKGYSETGMGLSLRGHITTDTTTHTSSGQGGVGVWVSKKSGTSDDGAVAHEQNIFHVRCKEAGNTIRTVFIVDEDGDLFADGGVGSTNMVTKFDDYEDAHLVRAFDIARADRKGQPIKDQWTKFIKYNESKLVELGILGDTLANGGLTNVTRLQQLHNGAIWQNYTAIQEVKQIVEQAFEKISQKLGIPKQELLALGS